MLADELNELIMQIEARGISIEDADETSQTPTIEDWMDTVSEAYNLRRHREKVFQTAQLFGEPTWDILLDLFMAELKNIKMQTTSVCIGAQVPQTTALRWIALLEREELVRRYRDSQDSRRVYIQLTDAALRKMVQIFYDRCFIIMHKKKHQPPTLSQLKPGSHEYDETREAILGETISQIRLRTSS
ncbi:helix-turn-helix domain-containing protein [Novosphingobium malaysiense]|uniref:MarR family transcriptional regulator n=1 Tax=Novosphingobium malaysiense TaxID=1348853 RepID=UPI0018CDD82E|nr:MarR family transcriptional regulator [Novosphingobium malaysiense]